MSDHEYNEPIDKASIWMQWLINGVLVAMIIALTGLILQVWTL